MALTQTQVSELYVAIFNRASEGEGNTYWIGTDLDSSAMADAMLATTDAQAYFGTSLDTNQAFVEHIYLNTLNKTVADDAEGIAYWVDLLDNGTSKGDLVTGLIAAINNAENAGAAQDQFNNRVAVSNYAADNVATAPADYATSLGFGADLTVTDAATTVLAAFTAVDAIVIVEEDAAGTTQMLTTAQDNLTGTDGSDTFSAYIFDNANTAQSGDMIAGGTGTDTLNADIGNSQNFAITLHTDSVENFAVRAEAVATDSNDNNMNSVQIDAERMEGTNRYETNNSRADVVIEDVRIADGQVTQNITVAMVATDPGTVDMGVYFDQHSLITSGTTTSGASLDLQIIDVLAAEAGSDPLLNNIYTSVSFNVDGVSKTLNFKDPGSLTTYAALTAEINDLITTAAVTDDSMRNLTAAETTAFTAPGSTAVGTTITITSSTGEILTEGSWESGLTADEESHYYTNQEPTPGDTSSALITSTIILDDVGRGSMGGDLIIGGLSTGTTSTSRGVEQFNISVDRNSQLQEIQSTNNTLQEVYIVNADNSDDSNDTATGSLTIAGDTNGDNDLPGVDANTAGLTDVRVLDASAMVGAVNIDAELTSNVTTKYMNLVDDAGNAAADNIDFLYTLGTSNDTLSLDISNANLAAAGSTSREDFNLSITAGAGNDTVSTLIGTGAGVATTGWYANSVDNANLAINAGSGADTITTTGAGNFSIDAGSGDDTVYADNSGTKAQWLVNATNTDIADLNGDALVTTFVVDGQLTVTFDDTEDTNNALGATSGYEVTVDIANTNYVTTSLNVNQAIKEAINDDAVLSKLLVAQDGPGNALVITSLVDGTMAANNLDIVVSENYTNGADATRDAAILTAFQTYMQDSTDTFADGVENAAGVAALNGLTGMGAGTAVLSTTAPSISNETQTVAVTALDGATDTTLFTANGTSVAYTTTANDVLLGTEGANLAATIATHADIASATFTGGNLITIVFNTGVNEAVAAIDSDGTGAYAAAAAGVATVFTETVAGGAVVAGTSTTGADSTSRSDNAITGNTGDDVLVLGTTETSVDTLDYNAAFGNDTIFNFDLAEDRLDFTDILTDVNSASASTISAQRIATTSTVENSAAIDLTSNEVAIVNDFAQTSATVDTWADMTAADIDTALSGVTDYANISTGATTDATTQTTQNSILMVENDLNAGEYKVFEVTETIATDDYTVELLGTIDFLELMDATMVVA